MRFLGKQPQWVLIALGAAAAIGAAALYVLPPWPSFLNLVFDALAFSFALVGGLLLISQFVLPVQTQRERREVFDHFMHYVSGSAGPILFVKDGQLVGRKEEMKRYGHGVALVDPVSAVVLEQAAAHKGWLAPSNMEAAGRGRHTPQPKPKGPPLVRAAGPGIVFIRPGERLVATLDLRRQSRGAMAPAITRDGLECKGYISVTFGLDPDPDGQAQDPSAHLPHERAERNQPAYPFHAGSAFRAVYGAALGEEQKIDWTNLPLMVAIESFRNILSEYKLDELFRPTAPTAYPFADFQGRVMNVVKTAPVLRERGILVYGVGVSDLSLPPQVLNQRVRSWQARWQRATIQQEAAVEKQTINKESRYQTDAQQQIFAEVQALLNATNDPVARNALTHMLVRALRRAGADPRNRQRLPAETLNTLDRLGEWIK